MSTKPGTIPSTLPALLFAGLIGAVTVGLVLDWSDIFSETILTGGDLPAHIVLMNELGKAIREHLTIIHYSTRFWSGFELFQFYFPLPYAVGAVLSWFIDSNVAIKLVVVAPLVLLPFSFARLAQVAGGGFVGTLIGSSLGVTFLFTRAHVMWGGNYFSTMAGMIGNGWMFVFMPLALSQVLQAHRSYGLSLSGAICIALTGLCHFYGLFTLAIFFSVIAAEDGWRVLHRRISWRPLLRFYSTFLLAALLLSWWALPLPFSSAFSSEFGGGWRIQLHETFDTSLLVVGGFSLLLHVVSLIRRTASPEERIFVVCLPLSVLAFYLSDHIPLAVFTNVRLWPTIYFSLIVVVILAAIRLERMIPPAATVLLLAIPWLLRPSGDAIREAKEWSLWNFRGLEQRAGWPEFSQLLAALRRLPAGRVSFESDDVNNTLLGTVRMFEAIPFLTHHDIVEGGIVNSASFPGIPYTLQCLTSRNCAGWPRGSVVPGRDLERGVDLMRGLGVRYHIASTQESRAAIERVQGVTPVFGSLHFGVYDVGTGAGENGGSTVSLVDVFDGPPVVLQTSGSGVALLSTPRIDRFRRAPFVFLDPKSPQPPDNWPRIDPRTFIDVSVREWSAGARVRDRSWENADITHPRRLNTFIHFPFRLEGLPRTFESLPNFMVADRSFDPDVFYYPADRAEMTVFLPLLRDQPGSALITPHFVGWRAFLGERELTEGAPVEIPFRPAGTGPSRQTIRFIPAPSPHHPTIDIFSDDPIVRTGFGTTDDIPIPKIATESCHPNLEVGFDRMRLQTSCPGLPHLIKFMYYPKWRADVPIFRGTNGYMVVVPKDETLELRHEPRPVDRIGWCLTALGVAWCAVHIARKQRGCRT